MYRELDGKAGKRMVNWQEQAVRVRELKQSE